MLFQEDEEDSREVLSLGVKTLGSKTKMAKLNRFCDLKQDYSIGSTCHCIVVGPS